VDLFATERALVSCPDGVVSRSEVVVVLQVVGEIPVTDRVYLGGVNAPNEGAVFFDHQDGFVCRQFPEPLVALVVFVLHGDPFLFFSFSSFSA
jgi:hypothetical protein